jgi:hypothetical protein
MLTEAACWIAASRGRQLMAGTSRSLQHQEADIRPLDRNGEGPLPPSAMRDALGKVRSSAALYSRSGRPY